MPLTEVEKTRREICCSVSGNQESCFVHVKFEALIRYTKAAAKKNHHYKAHVHTEVPYILCQRYFSYFNVHIK